MLNYFSSNKHSKQINKPTSQFFNMRIIFITISFLVLFLTIGKTQNQSVFPSVKAEALSDAIIADGFQNVSLYSFDSTLVINYENRVYRFEANAVYQLLELIIPTIEQSFSKLVLITKRQSIPLVAWEVDIQNYQAFRQQKIGIDQLKNHIYTSNDLSYVSHGTELVANKNKGNYKIEILIKPTLKLALGGFPEPVLHQINLQPIANLFLWKGAQLQLEGILPLSNEIEIPEEEFARPGILAFYQQIRLPKNFFAGLSVGYFTDKRYGVATELKKFFFNGNLLLKTRIGYTGHASYPRQVGIDSPVKEWEYATLNYLDYRLGIDYWLSKWNTRVGLSYGKVLHQKRVLHLEVSQQFKETEIGFFAFKTERGNNYGVQLAIPIFPKKYWKPKWISIRPTNHFSYTYHSTQNRIQDYITGIPTNENALNPSLLKNQLLSILGD